MPAQHGLNPFQLDAKAPQLDLKVDATLEQQPALGVLAHAVTAAVQASTGFTTERVGDELDGGFRGIAQITLAQPGAADAEFPRQTRRYGLRAAVENTGKHARERVTQMGMGGGLDQGGGGIDGTFGRSVKVEEAGRCEACQQAPILLEDGLAAQQYGTQAAGQAAVSFLAQHAHLRNGTVEHVEAFFGEKRGQQSAVVSVALGYRQQGVTGQYLNQLFDRGIEGQTRVLADPKAGAQGCVNRLLQSVHQPSPVPVQGHVPVPDEKVHPCLQNEFYFCRKPR